MYTYVNFNIFTTEIKETQVTSQVDNAIGHNLLNYANARGSGWVMLYFIGDYRDNELELKKKCCDRLIKLLTENRKRLG